MTAMFRGYAALRVALGSQGFLSRNQNISLKFFVVTTFFVMTPRSWEEYMCVF